MRNRRDKKPVVVLDFSTTPDASRLFSSVVIKCEVFVSNLSKFSWRGTEGGFITKGIVYPEIIFRTLFGTPNLSHCGMHAPNCPPRKLSILASLVRPFVLSGLTVIPVGIFGVPHWPAGGNVTARRICACCCGT